MTWFHHSNRFVFYERRRNRYWWSSLSIFTCIMRNIRCAMKESKYSRVRMRKIEELMYLLMPCPQYDRTTEQPLAVACFWISFPTSRYFVPGRTNERENRMMFWWERWIYSFPWLFPNIHRQYEPDRAIFDRRYQWKMFHWDQHEIHVYKHWYRLEIELNHRYSNHSLTI